MKTLEVRNVSQIIRGKVVLQDITFNVENSSIIGLLGPNGVGKSTLLRQISNGEETTGDIYINGVKNDFTKFRKDVLLVTSDITIPNLLSLYDYCKLLEISFDVDYDFVEEYCEKLEINKHAKVMNLSKGNKEMAQLIATLATSCNLILLDEPFTAIDIYKRDTVLQMIIDRKIEGKTIIITTHLVDDLGSIIDQVIYIHDTQIEFIMDSEQIEEEADSISTYLKNKYMEDKC